MSSDDHEPSLDADSVVEIVSPALRALALQCPLKSGENLDSCSLDASRQTVVPYLDAWLDWSKKLEEFIWSHGGYLFGPEVWLTATDIIADYRVLIRSIRDAVRTKNIPLLRKSGLLDDSLPTLSLNRHAVHDLLVEDGGFNLYRQAKAKADQLEMLQTVEIPRCDSPEAISPVRSCNSMAI